MAKSCKNDLTILPEESRRLIRNFEAYSGAFWKLINKSGELIVFRMNRCQREVYKSYARQMDGRGFVRINVLKLRQGGLTTLSTALATHFVMTRPAVALTLAHEEKLPQAWLRRCRTWRDQTPKDICPHVGGTNQNELYFDRIPSRYYVGTAAGGFPGMGDTISFLHLSECGSWDKPPINVEPNRVLLDLKPALPTGSTQRGTVVLRESTGKMAGDWWYNQWLSGKDSLDEYENIFLPWFLQEEYRRDDLASDVISVTPYERDVVLWAKEFDVKITRAQLAWRRHEIRQSPYLGNVDEWACRFPAYEHEAFLAPGLTLYTREMVSNARKTIREPQWRGDIVCDAEPISYSLRENESGELKIWEKPDRNHHYVLGADCQWGRKQTSDFDVLHVECLETGRLCAKVKGRYPLNQWAKIIAVMGHHYNTCPVAPERNALAANTLMPILLGNVSNWSYPNVWVRTDDIRLRGHRPQDYGWYTDEHSKGNLLAYTTTASVEGSFDWCDRDSVEQMAAVIRRDDQSVGAPEGMHDDDWMSRCIAGYVAHVERSRTQLYCEPVPKVFRMRTIEDRMAEMLDEN